MCWLEDSRGSMGPRECPADMVDNIRQRKVSVKIVHPHCEGEQEAGPECQTQHPADTAQWKTVPEPLWNFPRADVQVGRAISSILHLPM